MKNVVIYSCFFFLFLTFNGYSQGTTCANATPFCTSVGTPFTYINSTTGDMGTVKCLQTTPGPNWFYVKTTTPGTYVFHLTQSTTPGGTANIDVDFVAFGPYSAPQCTFGSGGGGLTNDCTSIGTPYGEVEDCSYCWDPTETMTLKPTTNCQVYMILITNYSRIAGYITFTQTSGPATDCNITNVTWAAPAPLCIDGASINLDLLITGGTPGGTWSGTGVTGNLFDPAVAGQGTFTITYTVNGGICPSTQSHDIVVNSGIVPTFSDLGPYCVGATPGNLPGTSTNAISGTWNPATISTTNAGTVVYTFTPNAGQCATTQTLSVTILSSGLIPTFTALGPYCVGESPAILPTTSDNGIAGTWNPAAISTTASGTDVYTFTPTISCADVTTMSVNVTSSFTPTFTDLGPYCVGESAGSLPATSNNGVSGTWNPANISTSASGTTVYTFTPTSSLCATTATMSVSVNDQNVPNFSAIPDFCAGTTAPVLVNTSPNGITGTWNPSNISNTTSGTYTFTPDAGQCALEQTLNVTVNPQNVSNFAPIPAFCTGSVAPVLENTSPNGITGTWNPTSINNTTSGTYTFTPDAGQCVVEQILNITVNPQTIPNFEVIPALCNGSIAPILGTTSPNGILGSWSPAIINNTNSGIYTFTPNAGQCATNASQTVTVLQNAGVLTVPNIFTPNGDNRNDVLGITGIKNFPNSTLVVYNRWGRKVFESNNYDCDQAADGTVSGNNCWDGGNLADDVYYYILTVNYDSYMDCVSNPVNYHGAITILR